MTLRRRALSLLLASGLAVPVGLAVPTQASAASNLSGIVLDSVGLDGTSLSSASSQLSPSYTATVVPWSSGFKIQTTNVSTGSTDNPYVLVSPPTGTTLTEGQTYPIGAQDATHVSVLAVNGLSYCRSSQTGTLTVLEATPSGSSFSSLAFTFHALCSGSPTELYGEVRVASSYDVVSTSASPRSFNFGSLPAGTTSAIKTFTITNNGSASAPLGQATVGGADAADFSMTSDTCSGTTLATGATCSLGVTATPESGSRAAVLSLPDGSARGARPISLQALGQVAPSTPQNVRTRTASDGVALTWTAPASNGGSNITGYDVLRGTDPNNLTLLGTPTLTDFADRIGDATTVGTSYYYAVRARSAVGTGDASAPVAGSTPAGVMSPTDRRVLTVEGDENGWPAARQGYVYVSTPDLPNAVMSTCSGSGSLCLSAGGPGLPQARLILSPPEGSVFSPGTYPLAASTDATHVGGYYSVGSMGTGFTSGTVTVDSALVDSAGVLLAFSGEVALAHVHYSVRFGTDDPLTAVSLPAIDAGTVVVGQAHPATATFSNLGDTAVSVSTVTTSPTTPGGADDWTLSGPDTCSGSVVAAGASCSVGLSVTPSTTGVATADLVIQDDTPLGRHVRSLTVLGLGAPPPPGYLAATRSSSGAVTLSWSDTSSSATAPTTFTVQAGPSADALTTIGTVAWTGSSSAYTFPDPDTSDSLRYYAVTGTNAAGTGPAAVLTVDARLATPANLRVSPLLGQALLSWAPASAYPAGPVTYDVYQGASATTLTKVLSTTVTHATLSGLSTGSTVYVAVLARTATGTSPRSTTVSFVSPSTELVTTALTDNGYLAPSLAAITPDSPDTLVLPLPATATDTDEITVSPNGMRTAFTGTTFSPYGDGSGDIWVRDTDGSGTPLHLTSGSAEDQDAAWSQDGSRLAFTRNDPTFTTSSLFLVAPTSGAVATAVPNSAQLSAPTWVGPHTLVAEDDSTATAPLVRIDTVSGARTPVPGTAGGYGPSARPDGTEVAFLVPGINDADAMRVVTLATGAVRSVTAPVNQGIGPISWSRDQATLFFVADSGGTTDVWKSPAAGTSTTKLTDGTRLITSVGLVTPDTMAPAVKVTALPPVTTATSIKVSYSASDAVNGIAAYDVSYTRQTATSSYGSTVLTGAGTTATSVTIKPSPGYRYCFSVRAHDRAGNISPWSAPTCTSAPLDDRSLTRSSGFSAITGSGYYLGTASSTKTYFQTLTTRLTNQPLYLVATTCPTCGSVEIRKGTTRVAVLSLVSSTTVNRHVLTIPVKSLAGAISIRVLSSGKLVLVDGLVVKPA